MIQESSMWSKGDQTSWQRCAAYVYTHAGACFFLLCLLHLVLWTAIPALTQPNAHLDVIECLVWGKEWQWGYHKHPPLHAWATEVFFAPFGKAIWPGFLLSQICVVLTFIAVWRVARPLVGRPSAFLSILLLEGIYYVNFTTPEFNSNVSLLPLWAWTTYAFHRALKKKTVLRWAVFGVMMGLSLLSKYTSLILAAVCGLYLLLSAHGRQFFRRGGLYLSCLICALLLIPHAQWVVDHDWQTISYFFGRSGGGDKAWWYRFVFFFAFLGKQLLVLMPAVFLFWSFRPHMTLMSSTVTRMLRRSEAQVWEKGFILFIAIGPLILTAVLALIFNLKIRSMWATPFFTYLPFAFVLVFLPYYPARVFEGFLKKWTAVFAFGLTAYGLMTVFQPYVLGSAKRAHFPGQIVAQVITDEWRKYTYKPLSFVIGEIWEAGNIGFYSPDRPAVIIDGDYALSPWVDPAALRETGAVVVWMIKNDEAEMPEHLRKRYPVAIPQPPLRVAYLTGAKIPPATIGWAVIPPKPDGRDHGDI